MADTPATVYLMSRGIAYTEHEYDYVEHGGTEVAQRHSGYQVGGTSPFGTRKKLPVYMERSVLELRKIYINGGRRGFLVGLAPGEIVRALAPGLVDVALDE